MKVIAVNGKVLLANGKAVKPPAGGGSGGFVASTVRQPTATIRTEAIVNHIVSNVFEELAE